jgi:NTE family protein
LGGGVARGRAHIGVLAELQRSGVPIDCIAGTSMGAIIGAAFCAGMDIPDLKSLASRTGWRQVTGLRFATDGLFTFNKLERWVESVVGEFDVRDLAIPFAAVASDLVTGERVILSRGRLCTALRASSSVPGFTSPVEWEGRQLVDGGITDNVPGDVARLLGADYVIGVDVFMPAFRRYLGPFSQGIAAIETLVRHAGQGPAECDAMIIPHLEGRSYFLFKQYEELIDLGEKAAREVVPRILSDLDAGAGAPSPVPSRLNATDPLQVSVHW